MKMCEEGKLKKKVVGNTLIFISVHSLLLAIVTCYSNQQIFRYIGQFLGNVDLIITNNLSCPCTGPDSCLQYFFCSPE